MKAKVIRTDYGRFIIRVIQGCQSFTLSSDSTRENCRFMAKMFNIALKKHDQEKLNVFQK
jgi:hypothetical protein